MVPNELSPKARNLMISEVLDQKQSISEVAKKYGVSRVTIYKWLKRREEEQKTSGEAELVNRERIIDRYWHQTPDKYEESILSLVSQHPEWGIRTLVKNLPKIGNSPIVGHHGVQNVLRRHNLSLYESRQAYATGQHTQVVGFIEKILVSVSDFFKIPAEKRHIYIKLFSIFSLSLFTTIVIAGIGSYAYGDAAGSGLGYKIGITFALTALVMGSFFFLYSLKYYFTLALVLSFSQKETEGKIIDQASGGMLDWLIKKNKTGNETSVGLTADLSHIKLTKKPFISVQIPFYNEKNVVERSIHAAVSFDYPAYEVILCDDSTDETTQIIQTRMKRYLFEGEKMKITKGEGYTLTEVEVKPGVTLKHLHRSSRSGYKGGALNLALKLSDPRTEKVSIFDADFVPYPDSLTLFLKYFQAQNDPRAAAVQGYQWHVLNKSENWITRGVRSEYAGSYVIERSGAEIYGGLKQISGSVYMIKKDVLEELGWGTSITEDFELTLRLYDAGYKVIYTPYIQAPAECASTLKRLIRQRMRWAEGHSFNVRKMFSKLLTNPNLSKAEKFEFVYLTPYYLQALFFMVGTLSWLISETIFKVRLPFWTELWGWSLVLTNMISLPLLNSVGLFLEESDERDYLGLGSFMALSYIIVPFQAYAAVKGFIEKEEGPWFRTPKTGRITDIFARGRFYRFISGILPVKPIGSNGELKEDYKYLALTTANSKFDSFKIMPKKYSLIGNFVVIISVLSSILLSYLGSTIKTGSIADLPIQTRVERVGDEGNFTASLLNLFSPTEVLASADKVQKIVVSGVKQVSMETLKVSLALVVIFTLSALIFLARRNKRTFKRAIKLVVVSCLIASWLLSGYPVFWNKPRFPPKIEEAKATISAVTVRGFADTNDASGTTVAVSPDANITVGKIAFVATASDNNQTADGASTLHSISDTDGHTWTRIAEYTETDGAADDGSTVGLFATKVTTQIDTTDSITLTLGTAKVDKIISVFEATFGNGTGWAIEQVGVGQAAISASVSSLPSREYLLIGAAASEGEDAAKAADADYTERIDTITSTTGALDINIATHVQTRIATLTSDTVTSTGWTNTNPITILAAIYEPTAALTGTVTASIAESDIVTGGKTVILTLTGTTWVASGSTFDNQRDEIRSGLDSAQSEGTGWDTIVKNNISVANVARTSDTVVTITLDAFASYNITAQETITATIPATALVGASQIVATPTFTVSTNALAFTNQSGDINTGTDSKTYESSAWTPPTSGMVIVFVLAHAPTSKRPPVPTVTNTQNITYTLIDEVYLDRERLFLYAAAASGSQNGTVTFDFGNFTQAGLAASFFSVSGVDLTNGVSGAFVQLARATGTAATSGSIPFASAQDSNNRPISAFAHPVNEATTFRTNWTELDDLATSNPGKALETQYRGDAFETTGSASWSPTSANWIGLGAEIRMNGTSTPTFSQTAFRIRADDSKALSANADADWANTLNSNASINPDYDFRIRLEVERPSGGALASGFELWYSRNDGDYRRVPDNATPWAAGSTSGQWGAQVIPSAQFVDGAATTNLLSQSAATFIAGTGSEDYQAASVSFTDPSHTEYEFPVLMRKLYEEQGHNADGTTYKFRLRRSGGGILTTYSQTPTVTISNRVGHIGGSVMETPMRYFAVDGNKNLYYLSEYTDIQTGSGSNSPAMMKSTDGGDSWNPVGVSTASQEFDLEAADMDLRGNTLYITMQGPNNSDSANYYEFNVSTHATTPDTWAVNDQLIEDVSPGAQQAAIVRRGDGTTIAVYRGALSGSNEQLWYSIRSSGGTWAAPIRLDSTASTDTLAAAVIRDSTDRIHIVYTAMASSKLNIYVKTLTTGDVLNGRVLINGPSTANMSTSSDYADLTPLINWTDGATERVGVSYRDIDDNKLYISTWAIGDTPSPSETVVSDAAIQFQEGQNGEPIADIAADDATDKLHALFANSTDADDIYYDTRVSGSWTTDVQEKDPTNGADWLRAQLFTHSAGNGSAKVVGYVWDDGSAGATGFARYDEKVVTYYDLSTYRFFYNNNSTDVGAVLANQDTAAGMTSDGQVIRMRLQLHIGGSQLASSGDNFKIQIASKVGGTCDTNMGTTDESYSDLSPSSGNIRYFDNNGGGVTDGAALTNNTNDPTHGHTNRNQTYEEANNFTNSQAIIGAGEDGKWDFTIEDNAAADNTTYCLRVVRSDNSVLETYTVVPEFTTVPENPLLLLGLYPLFNKLIKRIKKKKKAVL